MKATAIAPANIAFIKYWGKKDMELNLPYTDTVSMTLDKCLTKTTVEFSEKYSKDILMVSFYKKNMKEIQDEGKKHKVFELVNLFRKKTKITSFAKIVSENSFPSDAGIASSASAFAALVLAASTACGLSLSKKELSIYTRLGSGSGARSIPDGYVIWHKGNNLSSFAETLYPSSYWKLADIVAVVDPGIKEHSSTKGHSVAATSEFFAERLKHLPNRIQKLKLAMKNKMFKEFGEIIEEEARSMHAIALSSNPPVVYWNDGTKQIIVELMKMRGEGLLGYYTMDAGSNVHIICQEKDVEIINKRIKKLSTVQFTLINRPTKGAYLSSDHLF